MFWLNLGLNKKISVIIGVFLLIILSMTLITITRIGSLSEGAARMQEARQLETVMLAREIDHLKWVAAVQAFVLDPDLTELSVQEDPARCGLGKWYYGPERTRAEAVFPAVSGPLREMESYHNALHASASAIKNSRPRAGPKKRKRFSPRQRCPLWPGCKSSSGGSPPP